MCAAVNWNNDDRVRWTMKGGVVRKKQGAMQTAVLQCDYVSERKSRWFKSNTDDFFGQMWASVPTITVNTVNSLVLYRLSVCEVGSLRGARFRGKMKSTPQNAGAKACAR